MAGTYLALAVERAVIGWDGPGRRGSAGPRAEPRPARRPKRWEPTTASLEGAAGAAKSAPPSLFAARSSSSFNFRTSNMVRVDGCHALRGSKWWPRRDDGARKWAGGWTRSGRDGEDDSGHLNSDGQLTASAMRDRRRLMGSPARATRYDTTQPTSSDGNGEAAAAMDTAATNRTGTAHQHLGTGRLRIDRQQSAASTPPPSSRPFTDVYSAATDRNDRHGATMTNASLVHRVSILWPVARSSARRTARRPSRTMCT